jgi:hypothetical protein
MPSTNARISTVMAECSFTSLFLSMAFWIAANAFRTVFPMPEPEVDHRSHQHVSTEAATD